MTCYSTTTWRYVADMKCSLAWSLVYPSFKRIRLFVIEMFYTHVDGHLWALERMPVMVENVGG